MSEGFIVRTWNVLGVLYPTVVRKLSKSLEGEYKKGELRIAEGTPPHLFWRTEKHELFHTACDAIGITVTLQDVFGLSPEVAMKIEEEFNHKVMPVFLDALERNGCHQQPPPPREHGGDQ